MTIPPVKLRRLALLAFLCGPVSAAPILRLPNSALVWWSPGSTEYQTICASNAGDGSLSLSASVQSGVKWLAVQAGGPTQCIEFAVDPSSLPPGTHTAAVTISDPHAIDAPQVVTATVLVNGGDPVAIDQYIAPGYQAQFPLSDGCPSSTISMGTNTVSGGPWLSLVEQSQLLLDPSQPPGYVQVCDYEYVWMIPSWNMAPGTYSGSVWITDFASRTIPVTMRVTTQPIAVPSAIQINLRVAQGGPAVSYPFLPGISLANSGVGNLQVQGVSVAGVGVSAMQIGQQVYVTVDPASRAPGTYTGGMVTIQCNGVNCPVQIPVSLEIDPQAAPAINYQGVVDNVTFAAGAAMAQGDVCIVRGEQLSSNGPEWAAGFPLPISLGGATVLVGGVAAPLYYTSSGQIAFQVPNDTAAGTALVQVVRDRQPGNTVTVNVVASAPQIAAATDAGYNMRDASHPTHAGETLMLWVIGLGATNPPVAAGAAAPVNPPAVAVNPPQVKFLGYTNDMVLAAPSFAGLSGGSAGLYQVIVTVPAGVPKDLGFILLETPDGDSNRLPLVVQ